jgi:hypothetical protein
MGKNNKQIFGYYGILNLSDSFLKKSEYQAWLSEIKNKELTEENEKKYLNEFIEKFNNAKLQNKKYYNIQKWQVKERDRELRKHMKEKEKLKYINKDMLEEKQFVFDDEGRKEKEKRLLKELEQKRRFDEAVFNMSKEKADAMKEIDFKGNLMRHYYQTGDFEAAKDIHKQYFGKKEKNNNAPTDAVKNDIEIDEDD